MRPSAEIGALAISPIEDKEEDTGYDFFKKVRQLSKSNRSVTVDVDSQMIIYESSKGRGVSLNGRFQDKFGKKIYCRHLAAYLILKQPQGVKDYHQLYSSGYGFPMLTFFSNNHFDKKAWESKASYYHFSTRKHFGEVIGKILSSLKANTQTSLLLYTRYHAMALTLMHKQSQDESYYIVKFYDPNLTDKHKRIVVKSPSDLRDLHLKNLLNSEQLALYFQGSNEIIFMGFNSDYNQPAVTVVEDGQKPVAGVYALRFGLTKFLKSLLWDEKVRDEIEADSKLFSRYESAYHYARREGLTESSRLYLKALSQFDMISTSPDGIQVSFV